MKDTVSPGGTVLFMVSTDSVGVVGYAWTVSGGKIINGQGSSEITVEASKETKDAAVTVEVRLKGEGICWDNCPTTETKSIPILPL